MSTKVRQFNLENKEMLEVFNTKNKGQGKSTMASPSDIYDRYEKFVTGDFSSLSSVDNLLHPLSDGITNYESRFSEYIKNKNKAIEFNPGDGLRSFIYEGKITGYLQYKNQLKPRYYRIKRDLHIDDLLKVLKAKLQKLSFDELMYISRDFLLDKESLKKLIERTTKGKLVPGRTRWNMGLHFTWDDHRSGIYAYGIANDKIKGSVNSNEIMDAIAIITLVELRRFLGAINMNDHVFVNSEYVDKDFMVDHANDGAAEIFTYAYARNNIVKVIMNYVEAVSKMAKYTPDDGLFDANLAISEILLARRILVDETLYLTNVSKFFDIYKYLLITKTYKLQNQISIEAPELLDHNIVSTLSSIADFSLPILLDEDEIIAAQYNTYSPESIERALNRLSQIFVENDEIEVLPIKDFASNVYARCYSNRLNELQAMSIFTTDKVEGIFKDYIIIGDKKDKKTSELYIRPSVYGNVSEEINSFTGAVMNSFSPNKSAETIHSAISLDYGACGLFDMENLKKTVRYKYLNHLDMIAIAIDGGSVNLSSDSDISNVLNKILEGKSDAINAAKVSNHLVTDVEFGVKPIWNYFVSGRKFVRENISNASNFASNYFPMPISDYISTEDSAFYIAQKLHADGKSLDPAQVRVFNDSVDYNFSVFDSVFVDDEFKIGNQLDFVSYFTLKAYKLKSEDKTFFTKKVEEIEKEIEAVEHDEYLSDEAKVSAKEVLNKIKQNYSDKSSKCDKPDEWLINTQIPLSLLTPLQLNSLLNASFFRRPRFKQECSSNIFNMVNSVELALNNYKKYNKNVSDDAVKLEFYKKVTDSVGEVIRKSSLIRRWVYILANDIERKINQSSELYMHPFMTAEKRALINAIAAQTFLFAILLFDIVDVEAARKLNDICSWMLEKTPNSDIFGLGE